MVRQEAHKFQPVQVRTT